MALKSKCSHISVYIADRSRCRRRSYQRADGPQHGRIEATGVSRSEAIRRAILDSASRLRRPADLAAEAAALEEDEDDRREMLEVAALMESMRAPR